MPLEARRAAQAPAGLCVEEITTPDATAGLLADGLLRLEALRLGERIIAICYGLRRGTCGYAYLHAFDPEFAAFGPGWLLMATCLQTAAHEGVRRFGFLRGREPYKYAWGPAISPSGAGGSGGKFTCPRTPPGVR